MASFFPGVERGLKKNRRLHPGIKGKRPDHKAMRQREAAERNMVYQALSLLEKVKRNPRKYTDAQRAAAYGMV